MPAGPAEVTRSLKSVYYCTANFEKRSPDKAERDRYDAAQRTATPPRRARRFCVRRVCRVNLGSEADAGRDAEMRMASAVAVVAAAAVPATTCTTGGVDLANLRHTSHRRIRRSSAASDPSACPFQLGRCLWLPLPAAPQTVYQRGVPHTDRHGRPRIEFDPNTSFLPLALYHALTGTPAPINCAHPKRDCNYSLDVVASANFNTVHFWEGIHLDRGLADAETHGLQVIFHIEATSETLPLGDQYPYIDTPVVRAVANFSNHTALLGWMLEEEPSGAYYETATKTTKMQAAFARFMQRKAAIAAADPTHPAFVLDTQWYTCPGNKCGTGPGHLPSPTPAAECVGEWWLKWNTAGDISCHDNYAFPSGQPFFPGLTTLGAPTTWGGIPQTVALASAINNESKPVWITIQCHEIELLSAYGAHIPSPRQIRVQAWAGIIHGATGVIYYAFDSWVLRSSGEVGMAPDMAFNRGLDWAGHWPSNSSTGLNSESVAAWNAAKETNMELSALKHVILAPTSSEPYSVSLMAVPPPGTRCAWVRDGSDVASDLGSSDGGLNRAVSSDTPANCPSSNASVTPIRTLLKGPVEGAFYLFAVNLDNTALGARIELPRSLTPTQTEPPASDGKFETVFEGGRRLRATIASCSSFSCFVDGFEPFGVHVYRWVAPNL